MQANVTVAKAKARKTKWSRIAGNYELYLLLLPTLLYFAIFQYGPMYGVQIAFKNFVAVKGITGSSWVGFDNFERFFNSYQFWAVLKNTLGLSLYQLLAGFPLPIVLALLLNQLTHIRFKRFVQTVSYAPHFISGVVLVGMLYIFLSPRNGLVNSVIELYGGQPIFFFGDPDWFKSLYVWSGVWKEIGWSAVIYLAALTGINPDLHEAAVVDGASKLRRIWHVDIPGILPTIIILLILQTGNIMDVGFEKVYLMQNSLNLQTSEIISTYVYKAGLLQAQFSYSAAVGLFDSVINFILLLLVNRVARKIGQTALW
jgi:putative aldouronate transport system permease protein